MLSRISRVRVQATPTRLRQLRAYSSPHNASEAATPAEPGALDVDDAHLLPPDSTVLGSLDERNPIGEIARALYLPIGDEPHLAEAGLEPPQVIQQAVPEPASTDNSSSPLPAAPESEVLSAAEPAKAGSGRDLPGDSVLGLTREPTRVEYDKRRVVVEVHNGVRHMANAFAVIRYLERTYGRVSHFNLTRSADVEEDYRGSMFVTFKHPLSTQRIAQAGSLNVQIPEPARTIPFRPGSVGLDELQDVLVRVPEEFGDAEQQALFEAEASRRNAESEDASAAATDPQESAAEELKSSDTSAPSSSTSNAAVHARSLESNLPQLFLKIQPYRIGLETIEAARFGDIQGDFVRTRPMPGQQLTIGGGFASFSGFAHETASSERMQAVLRKWQPYMPIRPTQQLPDSEQPRQNSAPADEQPEPEEQPEPISLDALPKPKWQARTPKKHERPAPPPKQTPTVRVSAERKPERRQREPAASTATKTSALRPKGAAAIEEARRVAQAANERAAQGFQATASTPATNESAAQELGATASTPADAESAAGEPAVRDAPAVESKESTWQKMASRLSSFIGGSGGGSGTSPSNRQ